MSSEPVIAVRGVSKSYRDYNHPLQRLLSRFTGSCIGRHKEFHALRDVSFDVHKGETVGILGRNGSGKSTLLQIICGIRQPTTGTVSVKGRVSALLELGSGFHPEYTGRENIFLQGSVVGLDRAEIIARFDDIAAFADIGEYIDQPVHTYSSGMFLRLAFAVGIAVEPDILILDEALAVGDAAFQAKCFRKIGMLKEGGVAILFVSHSTEQISRLCDSAILLDDGALICRGDTDKTIREYLPRLFEVADSRSRQPDPSDVASCYRYDLGAAEAFCHRPGYCPTEHRWGTHDARIVDFSITLTSEDAASQEPRLKQMRVELVIRFFREVLYPIYGITLKTKDGIALFGTNSTEIGQKNSVPVRSQSPGTEVRICFGLSLPLCAGAYLLSVGVVDASCEGLVPLDRRYDSILIEVAYPPALQGMVDMNPSFSYIAH